MKNKKLIFRLLISFVMVFAVAFGFGLKTDMQTAEAAGEKTVKVYDASVENPSYTGVTVPSENLATISSLMTYVHGMYETYTTDNTYFYINGTLYAGTSDAALLENLPAGETAVYFYSSNSTYDITVEDEDGTTATDSQGLSVSPLTTVSELRTHLKDAYKTADLKLNNVFLDDDTRTLASYGFKFGDTITVSQSHIVFKPVIDGQRVYENSAPSIVTVKYYVTINDGVNSFVLVPKYDTTKFTLLNSQKEPQVTVGGDIDTSKITITGNETNDPEFVKIAYDKGEVYSNAGSNVVLLTLTFRVVNIPATTGHYKFSLVLDDTLKTTNKSSVAYRDLTGTGLGNFKEVKIEIDEAEQENVLDIYYREATEIVMSKESGESYVFGYDKEQVEIYRVSWGDNYTENITSRIEYKFSGDVNQEVVYTWYKLVEDTNNPGTYIPVGDPFTDAPLNAGRYTLTISALPTDDYAAPEPVTRTVIINKAYVSITIKNQTQTFGAPIDSLGIDAVNDINCSTKNNNGLFDVIGNIYGSDEITFDFYVNIDSSKRRYDDISDAYYYNAGTYTNGLAYKNVVVNDGNNNGGNYVVEITEGTYTVNKYQMKVWLSKSSITEQFNGGSIDDYMDIAEFGYHLQVYFGDMNINLNNSYNYLDGKDINGNDIANIDTNFINGLYEYDSTAYGTDMPEGETIVPAGTYTITPFVTFHESSDANNFDITVITSTYKINKFETVIKICAGSTTKTFNGGDKDAYDAPNFFIRNANDEVFAEDDLEDILSLLGDYTVNYSINFPETGVVQANDPENREEDYYVVDITSITFNIDDYEGNYADNFNIILADGWYYVNPKVVTLTAESKSSTYGQEPVELTYTYSGFCNSDTFTSPVTFTVKSGNTTIQLSSSTNAGIYTIVPFAQVSSNYTLNPVSGTYTISSTSSYDFQQYFSGLQLPYNGTPQDLLEDNSPSGITVKTVTGNLQTNVNTLTEDHSYTINVTLTLNSTYANNYNNGSDTFVLEPIKGKILPAPVTVTAENKGHVYATAPQELTYTVTGTVYGNDSLNITLTPEVELTALTPYREYTITVGASNSNYDITTVNGTYTVSKLGITANNAEHVYYGTPATLSYTPSVSVSGITVVYTLKDSNNQVVELNQSLPVGTYTIVPSVPSIENSAESIDFTNGTYTVSKAQASITSITASDVYYNRALDYTVTGVSIPGIANPVEGTDYTVTFTLDTTKAHGTTELDGVRVAGTYTVTVAVEETSNYDGATKSATFEIKKVKIGNPTTDYAVNGKVTWTEVTQDFGVVENEIQVVSPKDLVDGTTLTYTVDNQTCSVSGGFTPTATGTYTLVITSSNNNYETNEVPLNSVYKVEFIDGGAHPQNTYSDGLVLPADQYVFAGQKATEPATDPVLVGYDFDRYIDNNYYEQFNFNTTSIQGNTQIIVTWTIKTYTVTFKYTADAETEDTDLFEIEYDYKSVIFFTELTLNPTKSSGSPTFSYVFTYWLTDPVDGYTYGEGEYDLNSYTVLADTTFVAQYNQVTNKFTITYMTKGYLANDYSQYSTIQEVTYGTTIPYKTFESDRVWFITTPWHLGTEETLPTTMPATNFTVYSEVRFDVGQGDVNGNKAVTTDDITLYRQMIVGGYEMTVVAAGNEWTAAASYNANTRYFLVGVADNNGDTSRDIRDVSVTRMALVGGYTWVIEHGVRVTGDDIVRSTRVTSAADLKTALTTTNKKVSIIADINDAEDFVVSPAKDMYLDLCGHTLTVKSFVVSTTTSAVTLTIKNGTIVTTDGITISAPNGDVVLTDLVGYVDGNPVNLAAGSNSLHINGLVEFRNGTTETSTYAPVTVAGGTHVVVEEKSNIIAQKLVVPANETISIKNDSVEATAIVVEGTYTVDTASVVANFVYTTENLTDISTESELAAATGNCRLVADIEVNNNNGIDYNKNVTINLNGHDITFKKWGFNVVSNGTLTLNGKGNVSSVEATLCAQGGGILVINGGTYSATDNFVAGTQGSANNGGSSITINAGTFNGTITSAGYVACGIYVANSDTVVVNGGTFNITNGVGILARSGNTTVKSGVVFNVTGDGTLGKVGDSKVTVPSGEALVLDLKAGYPGGVPTLNNNTKNDVYVVVDGTYTFVNDDASFHAARGVYDNVILDADLSDYLYVTRDMNLYLNGHTVDAHETEWVAIYVVNGAKLTINGEGNVIATEGCVLALDGSTFEINGGTYTCYDNFVFGTNGTGGRGGNTITINAGIFNGGITSDGYVACGIYVANSDTVVVNGGTFNITNGVGILARSGSTTVNGGTFNVTGDSTLGKVGDSQVTVPAGQVLVLDLKANYPGGTPTLTNNTQYNIYTIENN